MKPDRALTPYARALADVVRPHVPVIPQDTPPHKGHGHDMAALVRLTGRTPQQIGLGIASIRAQFPPVPLVTLRWRNDRRVPLYAFDERDPAVAAWRAERLQYLYTHASRTWSGGLYQMTLLLPPRERAIAQLQYRNFLETIEAYATP